MCVWGGVLCVCACLCVRICVERKERDGESVFGRVVGGSRSEGAGSKGAAGGGEGEGGAMQVLGGGGTGY